MTISPSPCPRLRFFRVPCAFCVKIAWRSSRLGERQCLFFVFFVFCVVPKTNKEWSSLISDASAMRPYLFFDQSRIPAITQFSHPRSPARRVSGVAPAPKVGIRRDISPPQKITTVTHATLWHKVPSVFRSSFHFPPETFHRPALTFLLRPLRLLR